MMANSPLEIYSTVIGVKLYDDLFNIMVSTGLAFLPLVSLLFENITEPYESPFQHAAETSYRRVAVQFAILIFSIILFAAPTHQLNINTIQFHPNCSETSAQNSQFGDTGTTYDDVLGKFQYGDMYLPIGMIFVLSGASGVTNAAIISLPCQTDVQAMQNTIDTTRVTQDLANQLSRFQTECYAAAKNEFSTQTPDPSTYQTTMNNYGGQDDLGWVGSHTFQSMYYDNLYPSQPVSGFSYAAYPGQYGSHNQQAGVAPSEWGYPSCQEWWSDPEHGLQHQLVELAEEHHPQDSHLGELSLSEEVNKWLAQVKTTTGLGSQVTSSDVIAHDLLYDTGSESSFRGSSSFNNGNNTNIDNPSFEGRLAAVGGQAVKAPFAALDRAEAKQEVSIIQAVLMAMCLALGPVILVLGGYRVPVVFSYYFVVSSIIGITFIEDLVTYIENSLHASMNLDLYDLSLSPMLFNLFSKLYFYAPLMFLSLMSICGIYVGSALNQIFDNSSVGESSNLIKSAAKKGLSAVTKGAL